MMGSDGGRRPARGASITFTEVATFEVAHGKLGWPWLAFDASSPRFAYPLSEARISSRKLDGGLIVEAAAFALPADLMLPAVPPTGQLATDAGCDGFALGSDGSLLAVIGVVDHASVVVTCDAEGERMRSALETLAGPGLRARAVAFDRRGTRLWISAESATETVLVLCDARSHAVVGVTRSPAFPPPSMHELHVHSQDDAVLLLAACGEDGTFARVVGWAGDEVTSIPTALDEGGISAGFVGFSGNAAHVHLVEADELRTHAWPGLLELSSVELVDDFASSYSGAVVGELVLVDGEDAESHEDLVMAFDPSGLRGSLVTALAPAGMWAGRLGKDCLVTVESKGDPARARVIRVIPPPL